MKLSAYQRRKRDIAFWQQVAAEYKEAALVLAEQVGLLGAQPRVLLGHPVSGDRFLTGYDEFAMELCNRAATGRHRRELERRKKAGA